MVIEWLKFSVDPELRECFIQKDDEIWTPLLSSYPGFLGKQAWISPDDLSEVVIVIHWESMETWKAIPVEALAATEAEFEAAMGIATELVESKAYQIRRFMHTE